MRLAIVTTHPIQYNAPWFKMLAQEKGINVKVFYTWEQSQAKQKLDIDFGKVISWDVPLLDGYEYEFVKNTAETPGSHHFKGIINPTLNKDIENWQANAVLVFGWAFKSHLACLKYFKGKIPVLFRGDSTLLNETQGLKKILRRLFLKYVYRHIDYALYVGTNNKDYFLAHGLNEKQLVFAPHAIDNDRFGNDENKTKAVAWRKENGISEDAFVIMYAGKLMKLKNPYFLLQLAEKIKDRQIAFVFVGNGVLEGELKAKAVDDRILFVGFQNQSAMPIVYNACDIFVLPSFSETWGLGINEAMACGKFVIASDKVGAAVDLIENNKNGLRVNTSACEEVLSFIKNAKDDVQMKNVMQEMNKKILQTYSYRTLVNTIIYTLKRI